MIKVKELRELDAAAIGEKLLNEKESYFNLRFQHSIGQLKETSALKKTRKAIAKIMTVINEKKAVSKA